MRQKYNNILKATRLLSLVVLMVIGAGLKGWGQSVILGNDVKPAHTIYDVLYVIPNENTIVRFQKDNEDLGMDGYIRWYIEDKDGNISANEDELIERSNSNRSSRYTNGIAYYHTDPSGGYGTHAGEAASITCKFTLPRIQGGIKLVYEASSVAAEKNGNDLMPRAIGIRHVYEVKNALDRATELNTKRSSLQSLGINDKNLQKLRDANDISQYILNTYDIYMPAATSDGSVSTNFRLPENLTNYYVPQNLVGANDQVNNAQQATRVRWTINTFDGNKWTILNEYQYGMTSIPYILQQEFDSGVKRVSILAEVGYGNSNTSVNAWYPVSFMNVYLQENTSAMTESELKGYENNYAYIHRFEDKLLANQNLYERIAHIDAAYIAA